MNHLRRLGNRIEVTIPRDDGYQGRECPNSYCLGYFKITPGTGVQGPAPCHCPYCGHTGEHDTFRTQDQIEYAKSDVLHRVSEAVLKDLTAAMQFNLTAAMQFKEHPPREGFGISVSVKVEGRPTPVRHYREKQLE